MPDIAMCLNDKCPVRHQCYRYTAEPCSYRQAYCEFIPTGYGQGCAAFIQNTATGAMRPQGGKRP